jgi:hypothetical protein
MVILHWAIVFCGGFLIGEDILDAGSVGQFTGIGTLCLNRHATMGRLLVMDIRDEAMSLHEVLVGR